MQCLTFLEWKHRHLGPVQFRFVLVSETRLRTASRVHVLLQLSEWVFVIETSLLSVVSKRLNRHFSFFVQEM